MCETFPLKYYISSNVIVCVLNTAMRAALRKGQNDKVLDTLDSLIGLYGPTAGINTIFVDEL